MTSYLAYTRVSTAKQGERGVSLQEQRDAISRYAERHGLQIVRWFEERETAAKRGRPVFNQMLKLLRQGTTAGVVIHKIDRSARNLKDWADLGELIDSGVEVHFANESLDLHSRGGRLSADIQAVVAADYVRNLREETRKGFYGRLKQGLYPLPAPLGYLDRGKGKAKEPDPATAPLVRKAFELYGSGRYSLDTLLEELERIGLRNRRGGRISKNGLSRLLNNSFYVGIIHLDRTGETFLGTHELFVPKPLFDRVQLILRGKAATRSQTHDFVFRRMLACRRCGYSLVGELQKGHVYYRCHTKDCGPLCVREERIDAAVLDVLSPLQFTETEQAHLRGRMAALTTKWRETQEVAVNGLRLQQRQLQDRLARLTDAYLDGTIEKDLFEARRAALLTERRDSEEQLVRVQAGGADIAQRLAEFLELAGRAYPAYKAGLPFEKRQWLTILTSNRLVDAKSVEVMLSRPFDELANRFRNSNGAPYRDIPRTWDRLLPQLLGLLQAVPSGSQPYWRG